MNPYYQPYWISEEELEHYGIKGMKWKNHKTIPKDQLKGTNLKDVEVDQTLAWMKANDVSLKLPVIQKQGLVKPAEKDNAIKTKLKEFRKKLQSFGPNKVNKLRPKTIRMGQGFISGAVNTMKRKITSK